MKEDDKRNTLITQSQVAGSGPIAEFDSENKNRSSLV